MLEKIEILKQLNEINFKKIDPSKYVCMFILMEDNPRNRGCLDCPFNDECKEYKNLPENDDLFYEEYGNIKIVNNFLQIKLDKYNKIQKWKNLNS
jgi:hypothetical protein